MSIRIPPGFAEVWMSFNLSTDPELMYTSIGVDLANGVGADQASADSLLTAMKSAIDDLVASVYSLGPGHVIFGNDGGDIRVDGSIASTAGLAATGPLPQNTAWLLTKNTALGGRRNRGRLYIPGVSNNLVGANGVLTTAAIAVGNTAGTNLLNNLLATAEAEGVVLFHNSAPATPTPITSIKCQSRVATQRRRMRP